MAAQRRHTTDEAVAAARKMLNGGMTVAQVEQAIIENYDHICGWDWEQPRTLYFAQFGTVRAKLPLPEWTRAA